MAYHFRIVNIFAYDLHTTVAPILSQKLFAEDLRFLSSSYQENFVNRIEVNTTSFTIRPLPVLDQHHYFWESYSSIFRVGNHPDFWSLQIPFVCDVKNSPLELDLADLKVQAVIEPKIFLSAIGWSTNLYIRLIGEMEPESLISIVGRLFHQKATPYKLNGTPHTITGVFGYFASLIRSELHTRQKPPLDKMTLEKYFVLSPEQFTGKIQYYCPPNKPEHSSPSWVGELSGEDRMSQADCALMLSLLYGQPVSINDWFNWSYEGFLHTKMKDSSFALTDYERGTFLFMQENAAENADGKKRDALWCYTSNVRYCSMMTAFLLRFYEVSTREANVSAVSQLRSAIKIIFSHMPFDYPNAVCKNMHRHNGKIKEILAST